MLLCRHYDCISDSIVTTTITVRDVPDVIARKLKSRAERNHRSLQGEIMAILQAAAKEDLAWAVGQPQAVYVVAPTASTEDRRHQSVPKRKAAAAGRSAAEGLTLRDLWERGKANGLATPSESVDMIREDRDRR